MATKKQLERAAKELENFNELDFAILEAFQQMAQEDKDKLIDMMKLLIDDPEQAKKQMHEEMGISH